MHLLIAISLLGKTCGATDKKKGGKEKLKVARQKTLMFRDMIVHCDVP
jgi:hypothetical protein